MEALVSFCSIKKCLTVKREIGESAINSFSPSRGYNRCNEKLIKTSGVKNEPSAPLRSAGEYCVYSTRTSCIAFSSVTLET